ncbi:hypothetical protein PENTCL1PPCAC_17339 [Pristionchus entomophagus]|uniref:Nuclear receptor n=1 Tax=Pristionchus entomophagus TaxID=358040 RepID=A0AAV5TLL3_9BILA|nr:hypothetical protein PENTCL1PPCAC_17339 [Pristionchus entomophagus]
MAEDESGARLCLICRSKSDSAHFGVDSCRACAAFFRRTVSLNKTYICRQSNERCDVSKDAKFACRRCRYKRCLEIGMHPKNVHSKFHTRAKDESVSSDDEKPSKKFTRKNSDSETVVSDPGPSRHPLISPLLHAAPATTPLLKQLSDQYRILLAVRRSCEILLRTQSQSAESRISNDLINHDRVFPATIGHLGRSVRGTLQAYIDFAVSCFPEMETFDEHERWILLKTFKTCMFIFEGVYRVKKFMPGNNKVVMITSMTYLDVDNLDHYVSDAGDIHDKEHIKKLCRELTVQSMLLWLGPVLDKAEITEVEAIAIIGLLFWPNYLVKATKRVIDVSYQYQQRIFVELQTYYRDVLCLDDYSSRVAHITSILLCVQGIMQRLKEDMEIYRLLNVFDSNDLVYNVVQA